MERATPASTKETSRGAGGSAVRMMQLESPDFSPGGPIPKRHAFPPEGANVPPRLRWSGAPAKTAEFALVVDDPDAPRSTPWVHWVAWGIPASVNEMPSKPASEGKNDFGKTGWGGPLPPEGHGEHRYKFRLYALDAAPKTKPGASKDELLAAIRGHVLAEGESVGTYERP